MGLGKTYSTKYLADSNNNTGVAGQVLSTTSTGIDWADANTLPGAGLWLEIGNDIYNSNSGNVGIGTTSPASSNKLQVDGQVRVVGAQMIGNSTTSNVVTTGVQLHIKNSGEAKIRLEDSDSNNLAFDILVNEGAGFSIKETVGGDPGDDTRLFIEETSGNVGIGTTSPAQNFVVADATNGNGIELVPGATGTIQTYNRGTSTYANLNIDTLETRVRSIGATVFNNGSGFSESMRITSGGSVLVNTTSEQYISSGRGVIEINGDTGAGKGSLLGLKVGNTHGGYILADSTQMQVYNHLATPLKFFTNANERMRITSDGNVGIGTTDPGAKLEIQTLRESAIRLSSSDITAGVDELLSAIDFYSNDTGNEGVKASIQVKYGDVAANSYMTLNTGGNTEQMRITQLGNVGIGTTSPGATLHVKNAVGSYPFIVETPYDRVGKLISTDAGAELIIQDSGSTDNGNSISVSGDTMTLRTANSNRIRILANGNVGIGTTSPNAKLQVNSGGSGNVTSFQSDATAINEYAGITLHTQVVSNDDWYGSEIRSINTGGTPSVLNPRLGFFTQDLNTYLPVDRTEKLSILGNGNVGIGTTSPAAKLHLAGAGAPDIRIQDTDGTNQYGDRGHNNGQTTYVSRNNNAFGSHVFYSADGTTTQARVVFSQDFGTGSSMVTATGAAGSSYGGFLAVSSVATAQMWASDSGLIYIGSRSNHNINFTINNQVKAIINTSGNVGIGTTSPGTKLHIVQPGGSSQLTLERTGGGAGKVVLAGAAEGLIVYDDVYGPKMYVGTSGTYNGNVGIGTISPTSGIHVDTSQQAARFVSSQATGLEVQGGGNSQPIARFKDTAASEKVTISSTGKVGIGTTSPNQKLHVNGATQLGDFDPTVNFGTVALKVVEGTISTGPTLGSGTVGAQAVLYSNGDFGMYTGVSNNGDTWMQSQRNDAGTAAYDILLNPAGGNIGIGTITPSYKLDVSGNGRFTSTVLATNFILSSDKRLKENIASVEKESINVDWKTFNLKEGKEKRYGVIAQELEVEHPEFVRTDDEGMKSVAYIDLLIAKIAELEARLEKLEK